MFYIESRESGEVYRVYGVERRKSVLEDNKLSFFLIYVDGYWKWVYSEDYKPNNLMGGF